MKTKLHTAVRDGRKAVIPTQLPVVFSAGPIRNGPIWQNLAMRFAIKRDEKIFFASPLRDHDFDQTLERYLAPFTSDDNFPRQRAWENYYLDQAGEQGCVFFWLAKSLPRQAWTHPDKSYAQITMLELGTWLERKRLRPETRLAIGIEVGFPEASTVQFEIEEKLPGFPIQYSLSDTVDLAIDVALS